MMDFNESLALQVLVGDILKRFSFHGALATINLRCSVDLTPSGVALVVAITVPDRNTGKQSEVMFSHHLTGSLLQVQEHVVQHMLTAWIKSVWMHEFDEGLQFDGVRVHDPHVKDRKPSLHPRTGQ